MPQNSFITMKFKFKIKYLKLNLFRNLEAIFVKSLKKENFIIPVWGFNIKGYNNLIKSQSKKC